MPLRSGKADGGIVAVDVGAHLGQGLALGRIDLARHDRRAGLVLRQGQFAQTRPRARAEEADVIGNLEARHGHRVDRAVGHDHGIMRGKGLKLIRRRGEGQAGDLGDLVGDALGEPDRGRQAGADRRAALGQLHQIGQGRLDSLDALDDLLGIAAELLPQGNGGGVLGVGAADLDDVLPRLRLVIQGVVQGLQGGQQAVDDLLGAGDVHGCRIGVVRRLAHVHMVVRVNGSLGAHLAAQHLDGAVRDHLIGVHVGLGARAGLPDDQREMVVQLPLDHLIGGLEDGLTQFRIQLAQRHIGLGGGLLDDAQRANDRQGLRFPADLEVAQAALRLRAPVAAGGHIDRAKGISFDAGLLGIGHGQLSGSGEGSGLAPGWARV